MEVTADREKWTRAYENKQTPWDLDGPCAVARAHAAAGGVAGKRVYAPCCGTGGDAVHLAAAGGAALVVGVDVAAPAVAAAHARAAAAGVADRCLFLEADVASLETDALLARADAFERERGRGDAGAGARGFDAAFDRLGLQELWAATRRARRPIARIHASRDGNATRRPTRTRPRALSRGRSRWVQTRCSSRGTRTSTVRASRGAATARNEDAAAAAATQVRGRVDVSHVRGALRRAAAARIRARHAARAPARRLFRAAGLACGVPAHG
mmetsp:Transcript_14202/g.42662  ORF Transcript_14202/g.42662 Transcript_14202/m.42662 type:complete len:270 (+) Transcript_14202:186-995(+)